jgi:hypothetical protein
LNEEAQKERKWLRRKRKDKQNMKTRGEFMTHGERERERERER